ncbi:hypothetical protein [Kordiimonas sp. SCSIO 12610]|uniref:hypothetical protein n=1 Tax=Kordiimonas sp. SCSIO 12610 TaxID=2829597 RepID=UPI00210E3221|nr:hypothetical protein [Kordiimonas sp. SCSIO 12610]UTW53970.1 hypothetical protein KFF44_08960 [Kordiimonas sp. SCSIO 12610]
MPAFLLPLVAGAAIGSFLSVQADDAIESVTGQNSGINPLTLALLAGGSLFVYQRFLKK